MIDAVTREFPDFDLAFLPPIPAAWSDRSWHNDLCPCWSVEAPSGALVLVCVDYLSPESREFPEDERYSAHRVVEGARGLDEWPIAATDDWDELLAAVASVA